MSRGNLIFQLKYTPCGPMAYEDSATTTWRLSGDEDEYILEVACRLGRKVKKRRTAIGPKRAARWIEAISSAMISLFPQACPSCDGGYYELKTGDMYASVTLEWLNQAPEGAEPLDKLAQWLWDFVTPDLDFRWGDDLVIPLTVD